MRHQLVAPLTTPTARISEAAPAGIVTAVEPGSPADLAAIGPGDRIRAINGHPIRDVLDFQFYAADGDLLLLVERGERAFQVEIAADRPLGIRFGDVTFDGIRRCNNKCPFCFVHQNPRGLRRSLYIKDDDYRYSALYGGFITLTNLSEDDWRRIDEQRLSPLHVSVHATAVNLRRAVLGNPRAPDVMAQLRRLAAMGIQAHTQVVLCPGLNDGPHLDRTIADLAGLHPHVQSLSIVPVGLTDHGIRKVVETRRHTPEEAAAALAALEPWRRHFRRELGVSFVYPSDEFYLLARRPTPSARLYDGFAQYTNGVGMVRTILDQADRLCRRHPPGRARGVKATVICGTLAAPVLEAVCRRLAALSGAEIAVVPVENRLYGPSVTVSGLLSPTDVWPAIAARRAAGQLGDVLVAPRVMLDIPGERFLDDETPAGFARRLGTRLEFADDARELLRVLESG